MFKEESYWIRTALADLPLAGCKAVNLGSSTAEFRQFIQPHIHREVIAPLEEKGVNITQVDLKKEVGVDLVADLTSLDFTEQIKQQFDLALCTNMLEHVEDIPRVIRNLSSIVVPGGFMLFTVPKRYPLHFDPIDNGFRPTPKELATLVLEESKGHLIKGAVISIKDPSDYAVKQSRFPLWGYRLKLKYWLRWYFQVTGVLIQKGI